MLWRRRHLCNYRLCGNCSRCSQRTTSGCRRRRHDGITKAGDSGRKGVLTEQRERFARLRAISPRSEGDASDSRRPGRDLIDAMEVRVSSSGSPYLTLVALPRPPAQSRSRRARPGDA